VAIAELASELNAADKDALRDLLKRLGKGIAARLE